MIGALAPREAAVRLGTVVGLAQPPRNVAWARLTATAHGVYEFMVNGVPVSDCVLAPGWTAYEWRLQYQEFDITDLVRSGPARLALSAELGNGWYRGDLGFGGTRANYGEQTGLAAVLEIIYVDDAVQRVPTSLEWEARVSATTRNSLYHGQRIDARLRKASTVGSATAGTARLGHGMGPDPIPCPRTDSGAGAEAYPTAETDYLVVAVPYDRSTLVPQTAPFVRRQEVLRPERIWRSPSGATLMDFGQNLVGWVRFSVEGRRGAEITIRHAEVLKDGELATGPLRDARATDIFVLSGGLDAFEPTMTFHGFRYISVSGWPGELTPDSLEAVVVHSDMRPTGQFECSDPRVNQLVRNSIWSQKGNFLDVPTDCPQRDERLGWTGDVAVYAPTACFQFDVADFLHKWLQDLAAETAGQPGGIVPYVVPQVLKHGAAPADVARFGLGPTAVWGDAAIWVPQALWNAYGDRDRLAAHYPAMTTHLESIERVLSPTGLWDTGFQFGDWVDPDSPPDQPLRAKADPAVVATAALVRDAGFAAQAATALGLAADASRWARLHCRTRKAFQRHYVDRATGRVRSDCATVYALALHFDVLEPALVPLAAARLAELVRQACHRVSTGFAGTPYVTWALSENGYVDDAYRLLLAAQCPSWLYQVSMGATTLWERWDSLRPDGTLNADSMTSFNHYALGAVADWIYQVVGGIRPAAPGYRRIAIHPRPGPGITRVRAAHDSPVGLIAVSWRVVDDAVFQLEVSLPGRVPADIWLPDGRVVSARGGKHRFTVALPARACVPDAVSTSHAAA
ncbi:MAG: glycoside hydrolase family 78 protein [Bifidobacteriaceae bacterium]|jgi:alpha-L-rhamnosidase|nr:glycoside hydrolase family 78 protein [Bifidobacteriaceae bacterium]